MVAYDLSHLTQADDQAVIGPIQDDEALFLFALCRGMMVRRVLEIGGLDGYSARNFLAGVGEKGVVYTVDLNEVDRLAINHVPVLKDAGAISGEDVAWEPLDLVFFDCHAYEAQMGLFGNLVRDAVITERTVLALHDTNLHPTNATGWAGEIAGEGWLHQDVERRMVDAFKDMGYDAFSLHTEMGRHDESLPFRHGVTVMQRYRPLAAVVGEA